MGRHSAATCRGWPRARAPALATEKGAKGFGEVVRELSRVLLRLGPLKQTISPGAAEQKELWHEPRVCFVLPEHEAHPVPLLGAGPGAMKPSDLALHGRGAKICSRTLAEVISGQS